MRLPAGGVVPVGDGKGDSTVRGLVRLVNRRAGRGLVHLGDAVLGETAGAAYVRWPDGRQSVVTQATVPVAVMRQTAEVLELTHGRRDQGVRPGAAPPGSAWR